MYELTTSDGQAFAGSLREGFEEALAAHAGGFGSHAELLHYATRNGHRTRPVGCLLACSAVGGDWKLALDAALAIEYAHKSSVIRDDIVDGDDMRSGQPAVHVAYGVDKAIAVSDLLWTLALRQIAACRSPALADTSLRAFTNTLHDMAAGQLEDVAPSPHSTSVDQRLLVEECKTGALSGLACRLGALAGGGTLQEGDALARYGRKLGTAFQILNDVRNLSGVESARPVASDVRRRRYTVLIAYARANVAPDVRDMLDGIRLGTDEVTDTQVEKVRMALSECGAQRFGEDTAVRLMDDARGELQALAPSLARAILESLTRDALLAYAF